MNTYKYAGIDTYDINNGKGFGITLFVQGCPHHCEGCHNPQTWDFSGGNVFTYETLNQILSIASSDNIVRLTISGGEPFENTDLCDQIVSEFKNKYPNKSIWVYSGYTYEQLKTHFDSTTLLYLCDVLIDGPYIKEQRDLSLPFRGSSNQRIIDLKKTRETGKIVLLDI